MAQGIVSWLACVGMLVFAFAEIVSVVVRGCPWLLRRLSVRPGPVSIDRQTGPFARPSANHQCRRIYPPGSYKLNAALKRE